MSKPIKNSSELLYLHARQLFEQAQSKFEDGKIKTETGLVNSVFKAFEEFFVSVGKPKMVPRYAPEQGPPWSEDYNDMMNEIFQDLQMLYRELDILGKNLYTDFNHNTVQHEMMNKQYEEVLDKMRNLEIYAGISGTGVNVGRDDFFNKSKIDYSRIAGTPLEIVDGAVTLPQISRTNVAKSARASIIVGNRKANNYILGTESNGFPGNNTEIHSVTDEVLTNKNYIPTFLGEANNHGDYSDVLDGSPNTWFEYEKVNVREHDKVRVAKNLGWDYQVHENQTIAWAEDPDGGSLKLHIQITLEEEAVINQINCNMYIPANYGAKAAIVKNILISDGRDVPKSIFYQSKSDDEYSFHFQPTRAKVISILFEQREKYITDIGHIFYEKKAETEDKAEYALDFATKKQNNLPRVEGPLISLNDLGIKVDISPNNIEAHYNQRASGSSNNSNIGETINRLMSNSDLSTVDMGVEKFEGFRWCIGIRDIEIFSCEYATKGELVTQPFFFEKPLDKISLNVSENIPDSFIQNDAMRYDWLKYFISVDDGATWYPITPVSQEMISEDQPPKIYTIRTIESSEQHLNSKKAYIESEYPVYSIRLKMIGSRPDSDVVAFESKNNTSSLTKSSPIINSYLFHIETVKDISDSDESDRMIVNIADVNTGDDPFNPDDDEILDSDGDGIPDGEDDDPDNPNPPGGNDDDDDDGDDDNDDDNDNDDDDDSEGEKYPNSKKPPGLHVDIKSKKTKWCMHKELVIKGHVWKTDSIVTARLKIDGVVIEEWKVFVSGNHTSTLVNFEFRIPANTFTNPRTITVVVEGEVDGVKAIDTNIIKIIDCSTIPPEDQPIEPSEEKLGIIIDTKPTSICECEDLVFSGTIEGPNPIQSVTYKINGISVNPTSLGEPPFDNPCDNVGTTPPPVTPEPTTPPTVTPEPTTPPPVTPPPTTGWNINLSNVPSTLCNTTASNFSFTVGLASESKIKSYQVQYIYNGSNKGAIAQETNLSNVGTKTLTITNPLSYTGGKKAYYYPGDVIRLKIEMTDMNGNYYTETPSITVVECIEGIQPVNYDNGLTTPQGVDLNALKASASTLDTRYWNASNGYLTNMMLNGRTVNIRENFWLGRNDWLKIMDGEGILPEPIDPFYNILYSFTRKVQAGGVKLPEPFSKFYKFYTGTELPATISSSLRKTVANVASLYASYKLKKICVFDASEPDAFVYLEAGALETLGEYISKTKTFGLQWINFRDVAPSEGTMAFVTSYSGGPGETAWTEAFVSYMNIEPSSLNTSYAHPANLNAFRTQDWKNDGKRQEDSSIKPYYLSTKHFGKAELDYMNYAHVNNKNYMNIHHYAAAETLIHEIGHTVSVYASEVYNEGTSFTSHKYATDKGKALHNYKEFEEISGWTTSGSPSKSSFGSVVSGAKELPVSQYGSTLRSEDFAEAYAMYIINPALLSARWPKHYAFMEKYVKNMPKGNKVNIFQVKDTTDIKQEVTLPQQEHCGCKNKKPIIEQQAIISDSVPELPIQLTQDFDDTKYSSYEEQKAYESFGAWLDEFEEEEDCGCKNKKKNNQLQQPTQFKMLATSNERLFNITIPYWKLREVGADIGSTVKVEITVIDSTNKTIKKSFSFKVKDCENPETDVEGNPRKRDCWLFESLSVHYYDFDSSSIKEKVIPKSAIPYELSNGSGTTVTVGWRKVEKAPIVMHTSGYDESGYTFQIHAIGINYMNEYDQSHTVWAESILTSSVTVSNANKMVGPATKSANWTTDIQNGNYSTSPSLGKINDYVTFSMGSVWKDKACAISLKNFEPTQNKKPEDPDNPGGNPSDPEGGGETPPEECRENNTCNKLTHVMIQVYDDSDKQLKTFKINITEEKKSNYEISLQGQTMHLIVGWVNYFKGIAVQIKAATGTNNVLLTALGAVYKDNCGNSQTSWSTKLRHGTNGNKNPNFVLGSKKNIPSIYWINPDGTVDYPNATYIGRTGDMVVYNVGAKFTDRMCEPKQPVDEDVGIDPENPPDASVITFINPPTSMSVCEGSINIPWKVTDTVKIKKVTYTIFVNNVATSTQSINPGSNIREGSFTFNSTLYDPGSVIRFEVEATNTYGVPTKKTLEYTLVSCDSEPPKVYLTTDLLPDTGTTYCYGDLIDENKVPLRFKATDDTSLFKWDLKLNGVTKESGSYTSSPIVKDTGDKYFEIPITKPDMVSVTSGTATSVTKADIVFIFDTSSSMSGEINNMKANLKKFKDNLLAQNIDAYMGYIDSNHTNSSVQQNLIPASSFTLDGVVLNTSTWEGLAWKQFTSTTQGGLYFLNQFRPGAKRFFIVVTDASMNAALTTDVINQMTNNSITVYFVDKGIEKDYEKLAIATGGGRFDIDSTNFGVEMDGLINNVINATSKYTPDATYTFTGTATDMAGKTSTTSITMKFTDCEHNQNVSDAEESITVPHKVLVRLKWGAIPSDMDIYAYVNRDINRKIYYGTGNRDDANGIRARYTDSYGSMYLNDDHTSHNDAGDFESEYEIITIDGFANSNITVIVDRRDAMNSIDPTNPPRVEVINADTKAVVHSVTLPASDWSTRYMRACEIQLNASGLYAGILRGKAAISDDNPTL